MGRSKINPPAQFNLVTFVYEYTTNKILCRPGFYSHLEISTDLMSDLPKLIFLAIFFSIIARLFTSGANTGLLVVAIGTSE